MYAQESLDELNTIDQEIPIALHMQELERQQEMKGGGRPGQEQVRATLVLHALYTSCHSRIPSLTHSSNFYFSISFCFVLALQTQAGYVTRSEPPKPGEGPGLKVVRMMKMGDEITTK